ncbi:MAG: hypothetical protein JWP74_3054 [Marmoricola sp.]|nr:hypothetical protein [Marmoricola sp.]
MISERDRQVRSAAIKLIAFLLVSVVVTVTIIATVRPFGGSDRGTFRALFTSASRLAPGDDVRASGVVVGKVDAVSLEPDATAVVTFTLNKSLPLTTGTRAEIRYLDLVGDRTLALVPGSGSTLRAGGTIPLARTEPALDLNELFNGFKPLFAALSPTDVNDLAMDIIKTLQGEGSTVTSLLTHTESLTRTLADRDEVIGHVISNLNVVLGTVDDRHQRLDQLVTELSRFVGGIAHDRDAVGAAIDQIGKVTTVTADLLARARPDLRSDVDSLAREARTLDQPVNLALLEHVVDFLPVKYAAIARTASYGSWFNYYACELSVKFIDTSSSPPGILGVLLSRFNSINLNDSSPRCKR